MLNSSNILHSGMIWRLGLKHVGKNVQISDKAVFYGGDYITIGDNSRIDDFVILSAGEAGIHIGRHVHIACYASIVGKGKVTLSDFSAISGKCSIYSSSDRYDGSLMTNPTVPEPYRQTYHKDVYLGKHVVVGAGSVILPGIVLEDGCAVGAMSLMTKVSPIDRAYWKIWAGIPAKVIGNRQTDIFKLEKQFNEESSQLGDNL